MRWLTIAGLVVAALAQTGCAGTWDTLSSRSWRQAPFKNTYRMWVPEDAVAVLRADPPRSGQERAQAMRRLKEPLRNGLSPQDQDEMIDLLARTATADGSPILRLAAIEALAKFEDPRAAGILLAAYHSAHGRPNGTPDPLRSDPAIQLAGASTSRVSSLPLTGPTGFPPETVITIRCRIAEGLGRTGRAEAIPFLASVAAGPVSTGQAPDGADDRDIRLAAVRGLVHCRQPEAVTALAQVLSTEAGRDASQKDTALMARTHEGLVNLTGKRLPADPQQWNEVVQAGAEVVPEPSLIEQAVQNAAAWGKPKP